LSFSALPGRVRSTIYVLVALIVVVIVYRALGGS